MIEVMVLQTADSHMVHVGVVAAAELAPAMTIFRYLFLDPSWWWWDVIVDDHHMFRLWGGHWDRRHDYSLRLDAATEPVNAADETSQRGKGN